MTIDKKTPVPAGNQLTPAEVIDRLIDRLTEWVRIAPVEYPKEWAEIQIMIEKGNKRRERAAKRKEGRLNRSAFRRKSKS